MNGRCQRCHRKLTDDASMQRGFGPVCYGKHVAEKELESCQTKLFDVPTIKAGRGEIVFKRDSSGNVMTNVRHRWALHSPGGFEWGYEGSGPADLALNILLMVTDRKTAEVWHQTFKHDFIAKLPYDGGSMTVEEVREWLKKVKEE